MKSVRHAVIKKIIEQEVIETQEDLADALESVYGVQKEPTVYAVQKGTDAARHSRHPRADPCIHPFHAGTTQRAGGRLQGGAGGHHVIDQRHVRRQ